jgi:hypothetical protein
MLLANPLVWTAFVAMLTAILVLDFGVVGHGLQAVRVRVSD